MKWHNFDTDTFDEIPDIEALPDDRMIAYLPLFKQMTDGGPARALYRTLRAKGIDKLTAFTDALRACVGEPA